MGDCPCFPSELHQALAQAPGPGLSYTADIPVLLCPAMHVPASNPDPLTLLPGFSWDLPHHHVHVSPAGCPLLLSLLPALPPPWALWGCAVSLCLLCCHPQCPAPWPLHSSPLQLLPRTLLTALLIHSFYCVSFLDSLKKKTLLFIYMGFCSSTRKK